MTTATNHSEFNTFYTVTVTLPPCNAHTSLGCRPRSGGRGGARVCLLTWGPL